MNYRLYIAGPYTKGDVAQNVAKAITVADHIMTRRPEVAVFVPHLTHFMHLMFPREYEFWLAYDIEWLSQCNALLRLEGESAGADKEVEYATSIKIPVFLDIKTFIDFYDTYMMINTHKKTGKVEVKP